MDQGYATKHLCIVADFTSVAQDEAPTKPLPDGTEWITKRYSGT